MNSSVKLKL